MENTIFAILFYRHAELNLLSLGKQFGDFGRQDQRTPVVSAVEVHQCYGRLFGEIFVDEVSCFCEDL